MKHIHAILTVAAIVLLTATFAVTGCSGVAPDRVAAPLSSGETSVTEVTDDTQQAAETSEDAAVTGYCINTLADLFKAKGYLVIRGGEDFPAAFNNFPDVQQKLIELVGQDIFDWLSENVVGLLAFFPPPDTENVARRLMMAFQLKPDAIDVDAMATTIVTRLNALPAGTPGDKFTMVLPGSDAVPGAFSWGRMNAYNDVVIVGDLQGVEKAVAFEELAGACTYSALDFCGGKPSSAPLLYAWINGSFFVATGQADPAKLPADLVLEDTTMVMALTSVESKAALTIAVFEGELTAENVAAAVSARVNTATEVGKFFNTMFWTRIMSKKHDKEEWKNTLQSFTIRLDSTRVALDGIKQLMDNMSSMVDAIEAALANIQSIFADVDAGVIVLTNDQKVELQIFRDRKAALDIDIEALHAVTTLNDLSTKLPLLSDESEQIPDLIQDPISVDLSTSEQEALTVRVQELEAQVSQLQTAANTLNAGLGPLNVAATTLEADLNHFISSL